MKKLIFTKYFMLKRLNKKLFILLAIIGLLASCSDKYKYRIITIKRIIIENPTYSNFTYVGGGYLECVFTDSSNKYNIGDTIK